MNIIQYKGLRSFTNKLFGGHQNNPHKSSKTSAYDEIQNLKKQLLEALKRDTSISNTNHIIDIVRNIDVDGLERIYFHISNMNYGEYHTQQQDCYGAIDKEGLVEVYKSREPKEQIEAFSEYNDEEKRRIEEIKCILQRRKEEMQTENSDWAEKSFFQKLMSKIQGKQPKEFEELKKLLTLLPARFVEKGKNFKDTIKETHNPSNNNQQNRITENAPENKKGEDGR